MKTKKEPDHKTVSKFRSVYFKLSILIAILTTIISILIIIGVQAIFARNGIEQEAKNLHNLARAASLSIRAAIDFGLYDEAGHSLESFLEGRSVNYLILTDAEGKIIYAKNRDNANRDKYTDVAEDYKLSEGWRSVKIVQSIKMDDREIGKIYVSSSLESLYEEIQQFKMRAFLVFGVVFFLGIAGAFVIGRFITKPINSIVSDIRKISKGDLSIRSEIKTKDEIGYLSESFNLMVESLQFALSELAENNNRLQNEISVREKAEGELKKLSKAIIQSPVSITITNINKIIEYVNPRFLEINRIKYGDIVGKKSKFFEESERNPEKYNHLWDTILHGNMWRGELSTGFDDGGVIWESVTISALRDENGNITHFITVKEDITERKLLEETRKKYEFIVNTSHEFMLLINSRYQFEAVNNSFLNTFCLNRDDVIGKPLSDITGKEIFEAKIKDNLDMAFSGDIITTIDNFDYTGLREKHIKTTFYPFHDGEKITHVAALMRDVTKEILAEIQIKESEQLYRELVSRLPDLVIVHKNNRVLFANKAVTELLGYETEDVMNRDLTEFIVEEQRDLVKGNIMKRFAGEEVPRYQIQLITKENNRVFGEVRGSLITYKREPASLSVIINVTDRIKYEEELRKLNEDLEKRIQERTAELQNVVDLLKKEINERFAAQEKLSRSEEKFRALAEYSNDAIFRFNSEFEILYANKSTVKITDLTPDEVTGKIITGLNVSGIIREKVKESVNFVIETGAAKRVEFEIPGKGWYDLITSPEFHQEGVKTVLASARDITAIKENETALIQAKENALEASRLKSEFLANMSHEIRTPMNAIIGFADLLANTGMDDKQKSYLKNIKGGGKSLLTLINDILDLSKIEAGKLDLNPEPINLYKFVSEIKNIFSLKIEEKGLQFRISIDEDIPESILIDEIRLRQILFNLIGNSVKFTDRGFIELGVKKLFKDDERSKLDLTFIVRDSGIGIPSESISEIFETFKQHKLHDSKKYGGTGLGLAITKRLVEMMRGEISVSSDYGQGTEFRIVLRDINTATRKPVNFIHDEFQLERYRFDNQKVLIVDDVRTNRELIAEILTRVNLITDEASNGKEAIEKLESFMPDMIIMDVRMPEMDGYTAAGIIKNSGNPVPILAITASVMREDEIHLKKASFDDYLLKPIRINDLLEKLRKFLGEQQTAPSPAVEKSETDLTAGSSKIYDADELMEIKEIISTKLIPLYEEAKTGYFIVEVRNFAAAVLDFSSKYGMQSLANLSLDLNDAAGNFESERMIKITGEIHDKLSDILNPESGAGE